MNRYRSSKTLFIRTKTLFLSTVSSPLILTLRLLVVMCHLDPGPRIPALGIEALVALCAVQNRLVAADVDGDRVERVDEPEAELLALVVFADGDVFDVSDCAEVVDAEKINQ